VLEAIDADVIKTYVRLGLGVGLVAEMAVRDDPPGGDLAWRPVGHLFGRNTSRVAFKRGAYLRISSSHLPNCCPNASRPLIEKAMAERPGRTSYEL
jgi:LysR family cys regulon transcriptional activator